jgi:serine/threonine-protein kinase
MGDPIQSLNKALESRYRIERRLGEGGMATVYLGQDLRHDRRVAFKVLKPELAAVVGAERFLAEIRTTANLQHPHILPLFDSGEIGGFLFYVMPYVEGESLRELLDRENQLPVDQAVRIATDVAEALDYAHRQGVVHRDIKPANLLLLDGNPLLADFGIALALGAAGAGRLTETGLSLGTPHYMSPEQATGDFNVSPAADIYALGCVLFEMLGGEPPFTGPNAQAVLARVITEEPGSVKRHRPSVPANVDAAIRKALEKLPADRFRGGQDFATALSRPEFRHGEKTESGVGGASRMRAPLTLGLSAAVVILSLLSIWLWGTRGMEPPETSVVRLGLDLGGIELAPWGVVEISPDGDHFVVPGILDGAQSLFIRSMEEGDFRRMPMTENGGRAVFSPDGEWVVYQDPNGRSLKKVSLDGGAPFEILESGVTAPLPAQWTKEGEILIRGDDAIYRISEDGGRAEQILIRNGLHPTFQELPGGRAILVQEGDSILLLDPSTGSLRPLMSQAVSPHFLETGHILYGHPDGGLFAVRFDLASLEITGPPVPLIDRVLVDRELMHYSISETGTLVYRVGGMTRPTFQLLQVTFDKEEYPLPIESGWSNHPRWSPSGNSLAYTGDGPHVFVFDLDGESLPRQLTFEGQNLRPIWTPDGSRLIFESIRDGTLERDLFIVSSSGEVPEEPLLFMEGLQHPSGWTANGDLVFESGENNAVTNVWWEPSSSPGDPVPYFSTEADVDDVAISPDGRWAAYQSDETDLEEVYVNSFPEPSRAFRVTEGGGQFPRWSPDGRTLYYWSRENLPVDTLYAVEVETEPTFSVRSRAIVLTGDFFPEDWDLHPDGDRIIVSRQIPPSEINPEHDRWVVVLNFFEELRRRMPE